jgi:holin-like protein
MLIAFLSLIGCQLLGELLQEALRLPTPGPVIGMFLLAAVLVLGDRRGTEASPSALDEVAGSLIANMSLLFVPAGVGIIAERSLLRQEWLPILGGVLGSTIIGIVVTGLVMHWALRRSERASALPGQPDCGA